MSDYHTPRTIDATTGVLASAAAAPAPEEPATLPIGTVADILEAAKNDGTEEILEIPEWGMSVRIRSLTAADDARMKSASAIPGSNGQGPRVDIGAMERIQFERGVIEPKFRKEDVNTLQHRSSSGFRRVIRRLDEISGGSETQQTDDAEAQFQG